MNTVYIVWYDNAFDSFIDSAWSTKELAEARVCERENRGENRGWKHLIVEEIPIDSKFH